MTKLEKLFYVSIPSFLFVLIPFFLITGPFLSDLSLSLISSIYLIYCYEKKDYSFFKNKIFLLFLVFCIYIFLNSLIINPSNTSSLISTFFFFRFGVFVGAVIFLLNLNNKTLIYLYYSLLVCFTILVMDTFIQYFSGKNIIGWSMDDYERYRISSFFGDELILGSYLSRFAPLFLACTLFFKKKNKFINYYSLILLSLVFVSVFMSGERTSFFFILLSSAFIFIFLKKYRFRTIIILFFSFLILLITTYYNNSAKKRIFDLTITQFNLKLNNSEKRETKEKKLYFFSKQHSEHYLSAYKMFKDDNKLFGIGVKNFREKCNEPIYKISELSCSSHPHNTYIQLLTETGLVGISFFLFYLLYFLKILYNYFVLLKNNSLKNSDNLFCICLMTNIVLIFWPLVPSGNFFNNWLSIISVIPISLFFWKNKIN